MSRHPQFLPDLPACEILSLLASRYQAAAGVAYAAGQDELASQHRIAAAQLREFAQQLPSLPLPPHPTLRGLPPGDV